MFFRLFSVLKGFLENSQPEQDIGTDEGNRMLWAVEDDPSSPPGMFVETECGEPSLGWSMSSASSSEKLIWDPLAERKPLGFPRSF